MAKGLFSVYCDDEPLAAIKSRPSNSSQQQQVKRKLTTDQLLSNGKGKENSAPFHSLRDTAMGIKKKGTIDCGGENKVKKSSFLLPPILASKSSNSSSSSSSTSTIMKKSVVALGNGICTGNLRTREINFPISQSPVKITNIPSSHSSFIPPQVVTLRLEETFTSVEDSPSSAKDSGYGKSNGNESSSDGFESDMDLVEGDREEELTGEIIQMQFETQGDRRARALTESPLAEITQAFNSFGSFSLSPTPINHAPLFPSGNTRNRTSHLSPSASRKSATTTADLLPPVKPYQFSTTATTRKVKPSVAVIEERELRSMRM